MCRWGCPLVDTTYMCKWCGTRFCKDCLHGDFNGLMKEAGQCKICNQKRCQGKRVEYFPRKDAAGGDESTAGGKKGASSSRATTAKSSKSKKSAKAKSAKGKKSAKKGGKKSAGKKKRGKK